MVGRTVRWLRFALWMGGMAVCLGIVGAISTPLSAGAAASPKALVTRAAAVMDRIPFVAATGTIVQLGAGGRRSSLAISGACDASTVPRQYRTSTGRGLAYLRARAHLAGTLGSRSLDTHYILIGRGSAATSTLWERSTQTHGRWKVNTVEGTSLPILDMCGVLFMAPGGVPTNTPTSYRELGQTTIAGRAARHVRMTVNPPGEHWQYDWVIEARSLHVLRWVTLVRSNGQSMTSSYMYSGFGVPVRISAPG